MVGLQTSQALAVTLPTEEPQETCMDDTPGLLGSRAFWIAGLLSAACWCALALLLLF